ncbi:MAG: class I SAM-dependent methyltransferase, partial [Kiritimatiellia bacterium]
MNCTINGPACAQHGSAFEPIRRAELDEVLHLIPPKSRILEVGAGTGIQAKILAEHGFDVVGIDLASSHYRAVRVWPIQDYDGERIPYPDLSFDVVFSSNVLEHVANLPQFLAEVYRVLKPGGLAIHVVPSATWRFWTSLAHYPVSLFMVLRAVLWSRAHDHGLVLPSKLLAPRAIPVGRKLLRIFVPPPHGVRSNSFTELFLFSRFHWRKVLSGDGWNIEK